MTRTTLSRVILLILFHVCFAVDRGESFEVDTHTALSEQATSASSLDNFLTTVLPFDFPQGMNQVLKAGDQGTVLQLIAEVGAVNEDKPDIRSRHHFHDPTQAWGNAGLRWPILGQIGQSSVLWSQNAVQGLGGKHSWQDARNSYFSALTATDAAERKRLFADTFISLGHLIHLVQDAAAPSHTRNDSHIGVFVGQGYGFPIGNPDRFHHWANTVGQGQIASNQPFDPSILELSPNPLASIPIARIIDATDGDRGAPEAGNNIGIAEYSNGNFFSDDTIFKDYAHPALSSMEKIQAAGPNTTALRSYLNKRFGPGETKNGAGYLSAVESRLAGFLPVGFGNQQWELDDNVMAEYGSLLFPRAIGYSAGLIDYFFRGYIGGVGAYAGPTPGQEYPVDQPPTSVTVTDLANKTINEDTGQGTVRLVLKYSDREGTNETFPQYIVSNPVSMDLNQSGQTVTFSFDDPLPFPATLSPDLFASSVYVATLVYRGLLGNENDSIVVSGLCDVTPRQITFAHYRRVPGQITPGEFLFASNNCPD